MSISIYYKVVCKILVQQLTSLNLNVSTLDSSKARRYSSYCCGIVEHFDCHTKHSICDPNIVSIYCTSVENTLSLT